MEKETQKLPLYIKIIIPLTAAACIAVLLFLSVTRVYEKSAYICSDGIQFNLTDAESEEARCMLNGKIMYFKAPDCDFGANHYICFSAQKFCIPDDFTPVVKIGDRYFDITAEQMSYIRSLFEKYTDGT